MTLSMGTKTWVLLNNSRVVHEIISKRAGITHERPYFPIAGGLGRRLLHQLIMRSDSRNHGQLAEAASLGLLQAYMDEPRAWHTHHSRYAVAIMHRIVTNTPLQWTTAELEDLRQVTSTFPTSINSSFVEFFPQLSRLLKKLQFWRSLWEDMGTFHYNVFKHWWAEQAMYLTMLAIVARADNPLMAMNTWTMACLAYPAVMQQAREELSCVCGSNAHRLPTLDDLPRLPYMCAVVKEVLRWRPIVPLVPQRVLVEDLEFEGYRFPAGTEFLINSIPVCSNGYERPTEFWPERWLENNVSGGGIEQGLWQFTFCGGRRSCVGYRLAQKELVMALSRLLYCFDYSPAGAIDDEKLGHFGPGEPFPVKVTIRSPAHECLVRREVKKGGKNPIV
ncbi:cytochrome P450 [Aspergillus sergii]|uniref:Cytochrome P450 n=1 Tax=Aspergillus sergii TaxID=1034303 RepID=A0A5N6XPJ3_9EURO|nr:cytochrome P450 [Aspergillus sergii]